VFFFPDAKSVPKRESGPLHGREVPTRDPEGVKPEVYRFRSIRSFFGTSPENGGFNPLLATYNRNPTVKTNETTRSKPG
jgi:hypothetical protein